MIISFGQPSLVLLFPFCMPIFSFLRTYLENIVPFFTDAQGEKIIYPFFTSFLIMLSNLVMGIPVLIVYCINKRKAKIKANQFFQEEHLTKFTIQKIVIKEGFNYKVPLLIIIITMFVITILLSNIILNSSEDKILIGFKMNIFLIFFDSLFSFIILKYPLHKHQILAIIICVVGIIVVCINVLTNFEPGLLFSFLGVYLLVSMVDIMEKLLMEKQFINPSNLLFYIGLCGIILYVFILSRRS